MSFRVINIEDKVSHFAPHVGQNETITCCRKSLKSSNHEKLGKIALAVE